MSSKINKTKDKIVEAALDLFYQQGYEEASIKEIVNKAQVSKGAFYHYFKSKDSVLAVVIDDHVQQFLAIANLVVANVSLDAQQKFNQLFIDFQKYKFKHFKQLIKFDFILRQEGNVKLRERLMKRSLSLLSVPISQIIKQGIKEKVFNTKYPEEAAGLVIYLSEYLRDDITQNFITLHKSPKNLMILKKKFGFYQDAVSRILGSDKLLLSINSSLITAAHMKFKKYI